MKTSDSTSFYRLTDERNLQGNMFCYVCDRGFKKGDLVVVQREHHYRRFFHRKCFNSANARR